MKTIILLAYCRQTLQALQFIFRCLDDADGIAATRCCRQAQGRLGRYDTLPDDVGMGIGLVAGILRVGINGGDVFLAGVEER